MNPEILMKMLFKMLGINDSMRDELLHQFVDSVRKVREFDERLARIETRLGILATTPQIEDKTDGQS